MQCFISVELLWIITNSVAYHSRNFSSCLKSWVKMLALSQKALEGAPFSSFCSWWLHVFLGLYLHSSVSGSIFIWLFPLLRVPSCLFSCIRNLSLELGPMWIIQDDLICRSLFYYICNFFSPDRFIVPIRVSLTWMSQVGTTIQPITVGRGEDVTHLVRPVGNFKDFSFHSKWSN